MRLTSEKKTLLKKAYENDQILEMNTAFKIYSSRDSAKKAVKSLETHGFLEYIDYGKFRVVELPEDMRHLEEDSFTAGDYLGTILKKVMERIS